MIDMITDALRNCTDPKGASSAFIRNFILGRYPSVDGARFKTSFRKAFISGIQKNVLVRTKATEAAEGLNGRVKLAAKAKPRNKASVAVSSASERSSNPGPSSKAAPRKAKNSGSVAAEGRGKGAEPREPAGVQKKRAAGANTKPAVAGSASENGTARKKTAASSGAVPKAGKGAGVAAQARKGGGAAAKAEKGAAVKAGKRNAVAATGGKDNASDDEKTFVDVERCSDSADSAAERQRDDFPHEAARQSESEDSTEETMQRSEGEQSETEHRGESENSDAEAEGALNTIRTAETKRGPGRKIASKKPSRLRTTAEFDTARHEHSSGAGEPDASVPSASTTSNLSEPAETGGPTGDSLEHEVEPKAKKQRPKPARRAKN